MNLSLATRSTVLSAALLLALPFAASAQGVQLQMIGPVNVTGISAGGKVATGQAPGNFETFRWTAAEGVVRLGRDTAGPLDGKYSGTPSISQDGKVIAATIIDDTGSYATEGRWTAATGWQQLTPQPADGGQMDREDSSVWGMSGDGKVITGLYWRPGQPGGSAHGSVWQASTGMLGLPTDGGSSRVDGANRDGSVLVGWEEDPVTGGRRAAVWVDGERSILADGSSGEAAAVSASGRIVAGQSYDATSQRQVATVWQWSGSAWVQRQLGVLRGTSSTGYSYATGLSDDGRIVVGFNRKHFNVFETSAFIWTEETGMVDVMDFLRARGKDLSAEFKINFLPAITGKGDVIAAVGKDVAAPFTQRSLLIKLRRP
ncbi:MAG TPA: hypothetical protein VLA16_22530 [Ideonella sp.]|nr:hypothetical protein [Ideonella sp.]